MQFHANVYVHELEIVVFIKRTPDLQSFSQLDGIHGNPSHNVDWLLGSSVVELLFKIFHSEMMLLRQNWSILIMKNRNV